MTSRIDRTIASHRAALDRQERAAFAKMASAYQVALDSLAGDLSRLEGELKAMVEQGETPTVGRVFRLKQTGSLLLQAERQFSRFADGLGVQLDAEVANAVARAATDADELVRAALGPPPTGVVADALFTQLPDQSLRNVVATTAGGPLSDILDGFGPYAADVARQALAVGVASGMHPNLIARRLKDALGVPFHRAATIARTEVLRGYREATREFYRANSHTVTGWIWHCALNGHTCACCWAMHGRIFDFDTPMGTHPNCRCAMVPKTKTWKQLGFDVGGEAETAARIPSGASLFAKLPASTQRQILGPRGFGLYRSGEVELEDFVRRSESQDWGTTRQQASVAYALKQADKRTGGKRNAA